VAGNGSASRTIAAARPPGAYGSGACCHPDSRRLLIPSADSRLRFKATFFQALGDSGGDWERLRDDLLMLARTAPVAPGKPSPFGRTYLLDTVVLKRDISETGLRAGDLGAIVEILDSDHVEVFHVWNGNP
jgi:hypothetical protein